MQAKDSGMGHFALFLPRGIGAGAQGKPGVVVSQNGKTVLTSTPFCRAVVAKVGLRSWNMRCSRPVFLKFIYRGLPFCPGAFRAPGWAVPRQPVGWTPARRSSPFWSGSAPGSSQGYGRIACAPELSGLGCPHVQPQGRQFTFSQSVVQIQIEHVQEYPHPSSLQVVPDVLQRQDFHVQFSGIRDDAGTNNKLVIVWNSVANVRLGAKIVPRSQSGGRLSRCPW